VTKEARAFFREDMNRPIVNAHYNRGTQRIRFLTVFGQRPVRIAVLVRCFMSALHGLIIHVVYPLSAASS
jgi:hypothetical protein